MVVSVLWARRRAVEAVPASARLAAVGTAAPLARSLDPLSKPDGDHVFNRARWSWDALLRGRQLRARLGGWRPAHSSSGNLRPVLGGQLTAAQFGGDAGVIRWRQARCAALLSVMARMSKRREFFKILRAIVQFVVIDVVDMVTPRKSFSRMRCQPDHAGAVDIRALDTESGAHRFINPNEHAACGLAQPFPFEVGIASALVSPVGIARRDDPGRYLRALHRVLVATPRFGDTTQTIGAKPIRIAAAARLRAVQAAWTRHWLLAFTAPCFTHEPSVSRS